MKITARQFAALAFLAYGALFGLWLFRRLNPGRKSLLPVLTVQPDFGFAGVEEYAEEAVALAQRNSCVVVFELRGIKVTARPDSSPIGLVRAYHEEEANRRAEEAYRTGVEDQKAGTAPEPAATT